MEEVKKTGLTFIDTRRLANISYKDIKNGFVGFGYYLKIIRDEKLWQGQGYDNFNEFWVMNTGRTSLGRPGVSICMTNSASR